jgi:SAM-dependent methyltransferase
MTRGLDAVDASGWDARYAGAELVWGAQPNQFVVEELSGLPAGRALDLAAGEGRNAVWLAEQGWRVTAVDFSAVAVDRGRQLAAARGTAVDWVVADLREYQPEPGAYDAVVVAYLHLPLSDLETVLRRAASAVAPGGRMVVIGHDLTNLTEGVGGPQLPEVLYTPQSIATALSGLSVLRAERVHRPVLTGDGERQAVDTLVRAVRP